MDSVITTVVTYRGASEQGRAERWRGLAEHWRGCFLEEELDCAGALAAEERVLSLREERLASAEEGVALAGACLC